MDKLVTAGSILACLVVAVLLHRSSQGTERDRVRELRRMNDLEERRLYLWEKETKKDWEPDPPKPDRSGLAKLLEPSTGAAG